jgi:hypothetical protein
MEHKVDNKSDLEIQNSSQIDNIIDLEYNQCTLININLIIEEQV